MSSVDFGTFYAVYEYKIYAKFFNERYDVGAFYVKDYSFKNPKDLYKEFSGWSESAIDEMVFTTKEEAYMSAINKTIKKLNEVKKKMQLELNETKKKAQAK